jgi:hypothetical protein
VGTAIVAEVVGSVLAQGISKAMFSTKGHRYARPIESPITRAVNNYIEEIWKAAEDAQLERIDSYLEIIDTDENQGIEIQRTAWLSPHESNQLTGLTLFDSDNNEVAQEFEDSDAGLFSTVSDLRQLQT